MRTDLTLVADAIRSGDRLRIERAARHLTNLTMFGRYWRAGRGILLEERGGMWDIFPVDRWDDAHEAEQRILR